MNDVPVRPAASIILLRPQGQGHQILMGQRGRNAAFMPSKYVFPGGAVDAGDGDVPFIRPLPDICHNRLHPVFPPHHLAATALRELYEETGLMIGQKRPWPCPAPQGWQDFAAQDVQPCAHDLRFMFRAITPPVQPRRFDTYFFMAPAYAVLGPPDDFSAASDELSNLHWIDITDATQLDLPFITRVILAEVTHILNGNPQEGVPFFDNSGTTPAFRRIG